MVNILTILLTHFIMLVAAWRLMQRDDLEEDPKPEGAAADGDRP